MHNGTVVPEGGPRATSRRQFHVGRAHTALAAQVMGALSQPAGGRHQPLAAFLLRCTLLSAALVQWAHSDQALACSSPGGTFAAAAASSGVITAPGALQNLSCTFVIGSVGANTILSDIVADGEPVGLSLSIYGA